LRSTKKKSYKGTVKIYTSMLNVVQNKKTAIYILLELRVLGTGMCSTTFSLNLINIINRGSHQWRLSDFKNQHILAILQKSNMTIYWRLHVVRVVTFALVISKWIGSANASSSQSGTPTSTQMPSSQPSYPKVNLKFRVFVNTTSATAVDDETIKNAISNALQSQAAQEEFIQSLQETNSAFGSMSALQMTVDDLASAKPSRIPSQIPTKTQMPSASPSKMPSLQPSLQPSSQPSYPKVNLKFRVFVNTTSATAVDDETIKNAIINALQSQAAQEEFIQSLQETNSAFGSMSALQMTINDLASAEPSFMPSQMPSSSMHPSASGAPSSNPSAAPSEVPSLSSNPSAFPSGFPSLSSNPSSLPSLIPSYIPSISPSSVPSSSSKPSNFPSSRPSDVPSFVPSVSSQPSLLPSAKPSECKDEPDWAIFQNFGCENVTEVVEKNFNKDFCNFIGSQNFISNGKSVYEACCICGGSKYIPIAPSATPSVSYNPSAAPSKTALPSTSPSDGPSSLPSSSPSISPSALPSFQPSKCPNEPGWVTPSGEGCGDVELLAEHTPTACQLFASFYINGKTVFEACCICGGSDLFQVQPSSLPSTAPSFVPSYVPSMEPTEQPSAMPTSAPSKSPSQFPSIAPSMEPSISQYPVSEPSSSPSKCVSEGNWVYEFSPGRTIGCVEVQNYFDFGMYYICDLIKATISNGKSGTEACCACGGSDKIPVAPSTAPSMTQPPSFSPSNTLSEFPTEVPSKTPSNDPSQTPSVSPTTLPSSTPSQCVDESQWVVHGIFNCNNVNDVASNLDSNGKSLYCNFVSQTQNNGKTAKEACCVCGGGVHISLHPSLSSS
jgi:hypothetical protein